MFSKESLEKQRGLPVSINKKGELISLDDVVRGRRRAARFKNLPEERRARVVAARISEFKKFQLAILGEGIIGQRRAIQEVEQLTPVGRKLIDIEQRMIESVIAACRARPGGTSDAK